MEQPEQKRDLLSEIESSLIEGMGRTTSARLPSTAVEPHRPERFDQLVIPDDERGRMPYTKDAYLIQENPHLVQWEREVRKFLRRLSPEHGHRISAVMIYEWATGLLIKDLMAEEQRRKEQNLPTPVSSRIRPTWRADLRWINRLLREYFGKPYMTYIMGRKVPRTYRVPPGWYVYTHRPRTNTLYAEWASGVKL